MIIIIHRSMMTFPILIENGAIFRSFVSVNLYQICTLPSIFKFDTTYRNLWAEIRVKDDPGGPLTSTSCLASSSEQCSFWKWLKKWTKASRGTTRVLKRHKSFNKDQRNSCESLFCIFTASKNEKHDIFMIVRAQWAFACLPMTKRNKFHKSGIY